MFVRAYLRASTYEWTRPGRRRNSTPSRMSGDWRSLQVCRERERSEACSPELFRLLKDCRPGDVLLIEQVDRLSPPQLDD